jgi:hypothetical protein
MTDRERDEALQHYALTRAAHHADADGDKQIRRGLTHV